MATKSMEKWSPKSTPHVKGEFEPRVPGEEQRFSVTCEVCGGHWQGVCNTGRVRERILKFAMQHTHRDPLDVPTRR